MALQWQEQGLARASKQARVLLVLLLLLVVLVAETVLLWQQEVDLAVMLPPSEQSNRLVLQERAVATCSCL